MIELNRNLGLLQRSGIRLYTNLAKSVPDCVMLTIGEPDLDTDQQIKAAALASLFQERTHYAPNQGEPALRQEIAAFETLRGCETAPEEVLVTVGATGALFTALLGVLNPGDEVIIPTPAFPLYQSIVTVAGGKCVFLDTKKDDFQITKSALLPLISEKTKAIVLNSPNNPTGAVLKDASLAAVKDCVLGKPIFLICDNVYRGLGDPKAPDLCRDEELKAQILQCQSFSKPWAMTGWRVGYLTGPKEVVEKLLLLGAAQIASVPTFLQDACVTALSVDTGSAREIYERRRQYAASRLRAMGLAFPEPEGAFYIFPEVAKFGISDEEFCRRMILEGGVAAVPGSCFGCPGHIRISCACADAQLEEGLARLERFISTL